MIEILLVTLMVVTIIIAAFVVWLLIENKKLKRAFQRLEDFVERNNKDIAGLCSAAVSVDSRMLGNDALLKSMAEKIAQYEEQGCQSSQSAQPYHSAIQKIHNGATAEQLVSECGVSRDEAMLLIRLHGD